MNARQICLAAGLSAAPLDAVGEPLSAAPEAEALVAKADAAVRAGIYKH